jgi:LmbE family N-acetylglucosaminyl deacetylase
MEWIRIVICVILLSLTAAAQQRSRVLLGMFAHPDDETIVGPALSRYARDGVKVYVVFATDGQKCGVLTLAFRPGSNSVKYAGKNLPAPVGNSALSLQFSLA